MSKCLADYKYHHDDQVSLFLGDAFEVTTHLADKAVNCIVTSPPYFGLRDYGTERQYGLESSPSQYVEVMRRLFSEMRRVLADDGTLWLNIGDSYQSSGGHTSQGRSSQRRGRSNVEAQNAAKVVSGLPNKNLLGIPWRVAFALQDDGWILRNAIVWNKPNAMPESVTDRLSTRYEMLFLFSKQQRYWFDLDPIQEPLAYPEAANVVGGKHTEISSRRGGQYRPNHNGGRNPGDVWTIPTQPFSEAHFAVYPLALPTRCIVAGCKPGGTVLDPFNGSGTTGLAAQRTGRKYIGIDINRQYLNLTLTTRLKDMTLDFSEQA